MPAVVPPGYTRGPIMFIGPLAEARHTAPLLQSFWDEAGSYGARILIVPTAGTDPTTLARYGDWFTAAEAESVAVLPVYNRQQALDPAVITAVDQATGILIADGNPLRLAALLGGTPVAQAIRRANARGRVVCGVGRVGAVLCQHMVAYDNRAALPAPFLHRSLIQFAPGLGIINRIALDCDETPGSTFRTHLSRLLTAVAYNPFLIGVALDADTGAVVYADSTLEIFGAGSALVVDGWQLQHTDIHEHPDDTPMSVTGVQLHILGHGYTYQLDRHVAQRPPESEIPRSGYEAFSSF